MREILIFGVIGEGANTAEEIDKQLKASRGEAVNVRINSPGGQATEGLAIFRALKRYTGRVTTEVDAAAFSAASVIFQAGSVRTMARNAELMIHGAYIGQTGGNSGELSKTADILKRLDVQLADIYAQRSGRPASAWLAAMGSETWYNAQEAITAGLCDMVAAESKYAARFDAETIGRFSQRPERIAAHCRGTRPVGPATELAATLAGYAARVATIRREQFNYENSKGRQTGRGK